MRWENLTTGPGDRPDPAPALFDADSVTTRTFDSPEFRGSPSTRYTPGRS